MNKKLTRVLLVVVLLIWSAVIYQIIPSKEDDYKLQIDDFNELNSKNKNSEYYKLSLNYDDPFLNNAYVGTKFFQTEIVLPKIQDNKVNYTKQYSNSNNYRSNVLGNTKDNKETIVVWPNIKYAGKVNKRGLFIIGASKVIVQSKEVQLDVKFHSITADSAILEYKGEKRVFKKQ